MYDNSIHMIESNVDVKLMDLSEESKVTFGDCELTNFVYRTVEQSTGPFSADTIVQMLNISNQKENTYTVTLAASSLGFTAGSTTGGGFEGGIWYAINGETTLTKVTAVPTTLSNVKSIRFHACIICRNGKDKGNVIGKFRHLL